MSENPRWTLCRAAIGREPTGVTFVRWINEHWEEWHDKLGHKGSRLYCMECPRMQKAFDQWLRRKYLRLV